MLRLNRIAAISLIPLLLAACAKDSGTSGDTRGAGARGSDAPAPAAAGSQASRPVPSDRRVHFDFDSSDLDRGDIKVLDGWGAYLLANPGSRIVLEGHCDERGTREYNTALGERRAVAVRDHLVGSGVGAAQISVVSFGKEKPLAAGHDESAWRQNRRVELIVK